MLYKNEQLKLSEYPEIYERFVPKSHILRRIKENIDFSFVNELMEARYCKNNGRPAYSPELMVKILFLKMYCDLSDRDLISRCETDMAFKYFLDLNLEDNVPEHSLLTKFRKNRLTTELLDSLLSETVAQAIKKGIIKSGAIIVDSTHTRSKHTPQTASQLLKEMTKKLRQELHKTQKEIAMLFPEKPENEDDICEQIDYTAKLLKALKKEELITEKARRMYEKLEDTLEVPDLMNLQNQHEQDAKIGHKNADSNFFGYKEHIAATEEGIITGISVTNGNVADNKEFDNIVEQSIKNGVTVESVAGDKAYSTSEILKYGEKTNIKIIAKLKSNVKYKEYSSEFISFNKDADTYECIMGNLASRRTTKGNGSYEYAFSSTYCTTCPHKKKCIGSKKLKEGYKRIWSSTKSEIFAKHRAFEQEDAFKYRYKKRYVIEQLNAHLKGIFGMGKTYGTGLSSMRVQALLSAFSSNVLKITRLAQ